MATREQKPLFPNLIDEDIARSELNLEQRAVFTVSSYPKKWRRVVFREENEAGEVVEREVIVGKTKSGSAVGVLTIFHFKLYLVLIQLWEEAGRPVNDPVHFTGLEILRRLGYDKFGGNNYETIRQQLYDLAQFPIEFKTSFFVPNEGQFATLKPFSILAYLEIYERKYVTKRDKETRTLGYGEFQFNRHILQSLLANHTHPVLLDVVRELKKKELAILLYVYIDRNLAFKNRYEIELEKLFTHLDLRDYSIRCPADRKFVILPAIKNIRGKPLSTGVLTEARIVKTEDRKNYKAVFVKGSQQEHLAVQRETENQPQLPQQADAKSSFESELAAKLSKIGLSQSQIVYVCKTYDREKIIDWLNSQRYWKKKADNPAAFFLKALEDNWTPPSEYFRRKNAKHYVMWQCSNYDLCENSLKVFKSPKERVPQNFSTCPKCGKAVTIFDPDRIEYPD